MTYLLVTSGKDVHLYSPDTYGMETWGMNRQESIIKKQKYWYISSWIAGNEWVDDREYEFKLNVIIETNDKDRIKNFVEENYPNCLKRILEELETIEKDAKDFDDWCHRWLVNS